MTGCREITKYVTALRSKYQTADDGSGHSVGLTPAHIIERYTDQQIGGC
jgi:hypothetical protein